MAFPRCETDYEAGDNAAIETLKWESRVECEDPEIDAINETICHWEDDKTTTASTSAVRKSVTANTKWHSDSDHSIVADTQVWIGRGSSATSSRTAATVSSAGANTVRDARSSFTERPALPN